MGKEREMQPQPELPTPLEVNFDNIPQELQHLAQWVVWRYAVIDQETKKPPFSPRTGKRASVAEKTTWGSFQEAQRAYEYGHFAGVGFMLTPGIVGMDIDHCIVDGQPTAEAAEIIGLLPTYREYSPSGEGIRLFIQDVTLPGAYRRSGNVEIYQDRRYLTVTGKPLAGSPKTLSHNKTELNTVYQNIFRSQLSTQKENTGGVYARASYQQLRTDEQVLKKAYDAKNGEMFRRYYEGDHSLFEGTSQSHADFVLCLRLLYWTNGDSIQTDRLFRKSGLMRDKWSSKRGNTTYGALTIANAKRIGKY